MPELITDNSVAINAIKKCGILNWTKEEIQYHVIEEVLKK